MNNIHSLLR